MISLNHLISRLLVVPFVFILCICCSNSYADKTPRTIIKVYHYDGVENDELRKYFGQYKGIIRRRVTQISRKLSNPSRGEGFKYLRKLEVIESPQSAGSISHRELVWENTNSLQLLSGSVFDQGGSVTVMTEIYLGILPHYLQDSLVEIELNVSPEEYRKTSDIYSALTLYSILVDAIDIQPAHVTSEYISEMKNYINDLDQEAPLTLELISALEKVEGALMDKSKPGVSK